MPVIGRLDDQVEAVLINPLRRRDAGDEAARDESKSPAVPFKDTEHESGAEPAREKRVEESNADLPVWLL